MVVVNSGPTTSLRHQIRNRRPLLAGLGAVLTVVLATVGGAVLVPAISGPDPLVGPAPVVTGVHNDTRTPFTVVDMPALIAHTPEVSDFRFTGSSVPGRGFVRHAISYRSDGLLLTGTLVIPNQRPAAGAPLIVAVHGWRPPGEYVRGSGLIREENSLARAGFAVLHPDLRNHAGSTVESGAPVAEPVGYPADVIAAVLALRQANSAGIDLGRIGLFGRSMGGGAALQAAVARPDLFDAMLLYSPVSSSSADNFERFAHWAPGLPDTVEATFGTPRTNPRGWQESSARAYVGRLTMPVQIHHGTADLVTLPDWSRATVAAMESAGVDAEFVPWTDEGHRFQGAWPAFQRRVNDFFGRHVR